MPKTFQRGDHVDWNSEAGRVRGVIVKKVSSDVTVNGYVTMPQKMSRSTSSKATRPSTWPFTKAKR